MGQKGGVRPYSLAPLNILLQESKNTRDCPGERKGKGREEREASNSGSLAPQSPFHIF